MAPDPNKVSDAKETNEANEQRQNKDLRWYLPLYKAALAGDWESARSFLESDPDALTTPITDRGQMAIHVSVECLNNDKITMGRRVNMARRMELVVRLIERMPPEKLAIHDNKGNTPLHLATLAGSTPAAKALVDKNSQLPLVWGRGNCLPIHDAAQMGRRDTFLYLLEVTKISEQATPSPFSGEPGARLLLLLMLAELYDLARDLVGRYPALATTVDRTNRAPLEVAAIKPSSFPSAQRLNFWEYFIYSYVPNLETFGYKPQRGDTENQVKSEKDSPIQHWFHQFGGSYLISGLWKVLENLVPHIKHIRRTKLKHHQMILLVKDLCAKTAELDHGRAVTIFKKAIFSGASLGIQEIVEEIAKVFPDVMRYGDSDDRSVFEIAVVNRHENVYNLMYHMSHLRVFTSNHVDKQKNNIGHLAAYLAPAHRLQLISGAALQMQRELQWFKEVEGVVGFIERTYKNNEKKTAEAIFAEQHRDLVKEGESWMKGTANSCSIVAVLIATVVFAAAVTVPGGNNSSGHPNFSKDVSFIVFVISDALSLFFSTASIIMFLAVLTARYQQDDFLLALPRSLIIGLVTLFLSIASMMVAFSATLYLVFDHNRLWILAPVAAMAGLPITLFGFLQFPLLKDVIISTYGPSIFRQRDTGRRIYS